MLEARWLNYISAVNRHIEWRRWWQRPRSRGDRRAGFPTFELSSLGSNFSLKFCQFLCEPSNILAGLWFKLRRGPWLWTIFRRGVGGVIVNGLNCGQVADCGRQVGSGCPPDCRGRRREGGGSHGQLRQVGHLDRIRHGDWVTWPVTSGSHQDGKKKIWTVWWEPLTLQRKKGCRHLLVFPQRHDVAILHHFTGVAHHSKTILC